MFHQLKEPFNDPKVREAFSYAFDRDAWVKDVLSGLGSPTLTWIPKGYPGYKDGETRFGFDPAKAVQALKDSTYGGPDKLNALNPELTFSDTPRNRMRNEWLAAKYKEVLGVDFKLNPVEPTTYTALTKDVKTAPADLHSGLVRGLSRSAELAERVLEDRRLWRAHRLTRIRTSTRWSTRPTSSWIRPSVRICTRRRKTCWWAWPPWPLAWNNVNTYLVKPWVKGLTTTPQDSDWPGRHQSGRYHHRSVDDAAVVSV